MLPLPSLNSYFFGLNKWPIDKAPKVSNSSYLVGFGFLALFNLYAYQAVDKFVMFSYNWFNFYFQVPSLLTLALFCFLASYEMYIILPFYALFMFFYFFYGTKALTSKYYKRAPFLSSSHLVINWEVFLFAFFFLGWAYKVSKKYLLESFTLQESLFYKNGLPSVYLFEFTTFLVIMGWRYLNQGLIGYANVMYLKYYKFQHVETVLFTKLLFFLFSYTFFFFLLTIFKLGARLLFFFFWFLHFLLLSVFMFKEFTEFWAFLHQAAPSNLCKFTYFKFITYLLFFNFLHVYLVAGFSLICFFLFFNKLDSNYSDFYDLIHINIKNYYLIMWLTTLLFLSVYIINNLFLYHSWDLISA